MVVKRVSCTIPLKDFTWCHDKSLSLSSLLQKAIDVEREERTEDKKQYTMNSVKNQKTYNKDFYNGNRETR